jgi:hypothetical protein
MGVVIMWIADMLWEGSIEHEFPIHTICFWMMSYGVCFLGFLIFMESGSPSLGL